MRQLKITNKITARESLSLDKYLNDIGKIPMLTADERSIPCKSHSRRGIQMLWISLQSQIFDLWFLLQNNTKTRDFP